MKVSAAVRKRFEEETDPIRGLEAAVELWHREFMDGKVSAEELLRTQREEPDLEGTTLVMTTRAAFWQAFETARAQGRAEASRGPS